MCLSASNVSTGVWYDPTGVAIDDNGTSSGLISIRGTGNVSLERLERLEELVIEGLYSCVIPDEYGTSSTLVVGIYNTTTNS